MKLELIRLEFFRTFLLCFNLTKNNQTAHTNSREWNMSNRIALIYFITFIIFLLLFYTSNTHDNDIDQQTNKKSLTIQKKKSPRTIWLIKPYFRININPAPTPSIHAHFTRQIIHRQTTIKSKITKQQQPQQPKYQHCLGFTKRKRRELWVGKHFQHRL